MIAEFVEERAKKRAIEREREREVDVFCVSQSPRKCRYGVRRRKHESEREKERESKGWSRGSDGRLGF
jgi:hypothetical protein